MADDSDEDKRTAWSYLVKAWHNRGKPQESMEYRDVTYRILFDEEGRPKFHHNHGMRFQPWQILMHQAKQPEVLVIGGVGCGKTAGIALSAMVYAATVPNYRAVILAPSMNQVEQTWYYINQTGINTPYWERWVHGNPSKPHPTLRLKNSFIGESEIKLMSLADADVRKILTIEVDHVFIDQTEAFDNLNELRKNVGTRVRGMVSGRARIGTVVMIANSADNEEMWYLRELAEYQPKRILFLNPKTADNPYLTRWQIDNIRARFENEDEANVWMNADRPLGSGEVFTRKIIEMCTNKGINETAKSAYDQAIPDALYKEVPNIGVQHFQLPPDDNRYYLVVGDPGQDNPPNRNSPVIMVWDVTEFPAAPAKMVAFHWVSGNGTYWSFINEFERLVYLYKAQGRCAFDSTGMQKMIDEVVYAERGLLVEGMNSSTITEKMAIVNAGRTLMGRGRLMFPYLSHLLAQLIRYTIPEKPRVPQDLVMCLCMSAAFMMRYYYADVDGGSGAKMPLQTVIKPRYARAGIPRYSGRK